MVITGGCGFIGANASEAFLRRGWEVVAYDNFSRAGSEHNAAWLRSLDERRLTIVEADVRDLRRLEETIAGAAVVLHLAAQTAVTTSIAEPLEDFSVNALGGLNVLEAVRRRAPEAIVLYSSTNKVYGPLAGLQLESKGLRHRLPEQPLGINEQMPVDLHSPYGCSKGVCDLYMLDYARVYGLRTVVFRQSCVYGPRQFGVEEQGWLAHFAITAKLGGGITIYGDGRQVRDVLHVADLLDVYQAAIDRIDEAQGQAYNIGGGPEKTFSLLEAIYRLEARYDRAIPLRFEEWRAADQCVYVSDIRKAETDLGWRPKIGAEEGLAALCEWVEDNTALFGSSCAIHDTALTLPQPL
jgi:CDP-paratose 2-epimerase